MRFFNSYRTLIRDKLSDWWNIGRERLIHWIQWAKTADWPTLIRTSPVLIRDTAKEQWRLFKLKERREQTRIVAIGAAIFLVIVTILWLLNGDSSPFGRSKPPIPVAVMSVTEGAFPVVVDGLGTVTSRRVVTIRTQVNGQLTQVLFQEGQIVQEGDELAIVDPRTYEAQVKQAQGKLDQDKAQLQNARVLLKRYQILYKQDSVARQDLDSQAAAVLQYEGMVVTDEGALDTAKVQLSFTRIVAPFDGRLGLRQVDPGNIVSTTDTNGIVIITQIHPIDVLFTVPSEQLPAILAHFNAGDEMPVQAFNRDFKTVIATGILKSIDNEIDTTTGMVKMKAEFANEDNTLFPNQFVNARLQIEIRDHSTLVPANAILRGAEGTYVYVVDNQNVVSARPIKLGGANDQVAEVLNGLTAGEQVVTDGFDKLRPGTKVSIPKAAAHR